MEKYSTREKYTKISLKSGQRKLYFNELEFYIEIYKLDPDATIVYVGAAPGTHTAYLAKMFPTFTFKLYDPNDFSALLKDLKNVELYNEYFTEDSIKKIGAAHIYFLSDIRTGEDSEYVEQDMQRQMEWCDILKPKLAMLKFRLPWTPGRTLYFDGEIYTQTRIGDTSTEMRLWTNCKRKIEWDHEEYNNRVFYFQKRQRNAWHTFTLPNIQGFDHCYDCWSENRISVDYLKLGITDIQPLISAGNFSRVDVPPHGLMKYERDIHKKILMLRDITLSKETVGYTDSDANEKFELLSWIKPRQDCPNFGLLTTDTPYAIDKFPKNLRTGFTRNIYDVRPTAMFPVEIYDACGRVDVRRGEFLSMLEFLTEHEGTTVIIYTEYISSQYARLAELFPERKFIIYFPFKNPSITAPNLKFIYEYLNTEEIKKWTGCLLIMNISKFLDVPTIAGAFTAIDLQYNICQKMRPKMAMYNIFGLPGSFRAHKGTVRIFPFGLYNKPILKLITDGRSSQKYDGLDLMNRVFTHYFYARPQHYMHPIPVEVVSEKKIKVSRTGIDYCYDCRTQYEIWHKYHKDPSKIEAEILFAKESDEENALKNYPHGMLPQMEDISKKIHQLTLYTLFYHNSRLNIIKLLSVKRSPAAKHNLDKIDKALYKRAAEKKIDPTLYAWDLRF
jgi:hypothetical protein